MVRCPAAVTCCSHLESDLAGLDTLLFGCSLLKCYHELAYCKEPAAAGTLCVSDQARSCLMQAIAKTPTALQVQRGTMGMHESAALIERCTHRAACCPAT